MARRILALRNVAALFLAAVVLAASAPALGQCTSNSQCVDSLFCTADICFNPGPSGQCVHPQTSCSDGAYCNGAENCNENRDLCEFACVGGTICDSGFCVCNQPGGCPNGNVGQACSLFVQPVNCPEGEHCNEALDACTDCLTSADCTTPPRLLCSTAGECVQCTTHQQCQDGAYCDGQESCNFSTGLCEEGTPIQCPFGEFCSNAFQRCLECESDSDCSDGLFCNGAETCNKTTFECQSGATVNCKICIGGTNDGLNCNTQTDCPGGGNCRTYFCNESVDACVQCLQNSHCSDVDYCTRNLCIFNACVFEHTNSLCSDGQFCNGSELCVGGINNPSCNNGTGAGCCRKACLGGGTCNVSTHLCVGGSNPNTACDPSVQPPSTDDGVACTNDSCNEATDSIDHTPNHQFCSDGLFCNGAETCDPPAEGSDTEGCVDGNTIDCSAMSRFCRNAFCDEPNDRCSTAPANTAAACDDDNPCTAATSCSSTAKTCSNNDAVTCTGNSQCPARAGICSNVPVLCNTNANCPAGGTCGGAGTCLGGVCANLPPGANDPYRCVQLEWRNVTQSVPVNGTATMDLYAVASGCNVSNQDGCPSSQHRIAGLTAILDWNPQQLEVRPSTIGNLNPEDPCDSGSACHVCPAGQANWAQSLWDDDCAGDAINSPCTGFPLLPANDGDAHYVAIAPVGDEFCLEAPPTCVPGSGLFVTRFKFKALRGGTATVTLDPCEGELSRTGVISNTPPPAGYVNAEVLKSIGPAAQITVTCANTGECNDANPCTTEQCVNNLCQFTNVTGSCNNGLFCDGSNDTCNNGVCTGGGNPCTNPARPFCNESLDRCDACRTVTDCIDTTTVGQTVVPNVCTDDSCNTAGDCVHTPYDCDDGAACTADSCQIVVVPPNVTPVCQNVPNDALCATGEFCSALRCEAGEGCVPDHACFSTTGNPCPDNDSCDEDTDTCGGCVAPAVAAVGCRFLRLTPSDQGATPIALLLEGDCETSGVQCVSKYVQSHCNGGPRDGLLCASNADCPKICVGGTVPGATCAVNFDCGVGGTCVGFCDKSKLGENPVFLTAAQWGILSIKGAEVRPNTIYRGMSDCNFTGGRILSAANQTRTWRWGDADGNGLVNVIDISTVVNFLKNLPATYEGTNVWPCETDNTVNVLDLSKVVDSVRELPFSCPDVCD